MSEIISGNKGEINESKLHDYTRKQRWNSVYHFRIHIRKDLSVSGTASGEELRETKNFFRIYERNGYVNLNVKADRSGVIFGEVPMNLYRLVIIRIRNIGIPLF